MGRATSAQSDTDSGAVLVEERIGVEYVNVKIVADNIDAVVNVSENVDGVLQAGANATASAAAAALSAAAADNSSTDATNAKVAAETAQNEAETAQTAAAASQAISTAAALAADASATAAAQSADEAVAAMETKATQANSRAAMSLVAATDGAVCLLSEAGRAGKFDFRAGDYTAELASDPLQGIYIPGIGGAWVRDWDEIRGRPEWFGAISNNGAIDNRPAFDAALALCPLVEFGSSDYYITGRWDIDRSYVAAVGAFNPDGYDQAHGARIISTNTAEDVCKVAPVGVPASTGDFLRNVTIKGLCFMHVGARTMPGIGDEKGGVAGLRCNYLIDSTIEDNYANEPLIGFAYYGVIGSSLRRNRVFRSALFGGNDFVIGHLLTGAAVAGLVGNNASYLGNKWNCSVQGDALGLDTLDRVGIWFDGAIADGFNSYPETLGCGIRVTGLGAADVSPSNGDFYIEHPVVDQYDGVSIEVSGIAKTGNVRIIEPYAGAPSTTEYIIRVRDSGGAVDILGGDLYGTPAANQTVGINIENSTGSVRIMGTVLHEIGRPVTVINSQNVIVEPRIVNHSNVSPTYQAAVALVDVQRGRVAPVVIGMADAFPLGIMTFDALCSNLTYDVTGIDPVAISGGAANRLIDNGSQITDFGNFGLDCFAAGTGLTIVEPSSSFADLTGDPEDNSALALALAEKADMANPDFTGQIDLNQGNQVHVPSINLTNVGQGTTGIKLTSAVDGSSVNALDRGAGGPWNIHATHTTFNFLSNNNGGDGSAQAFYFGNLNVPARHVAVLQHQTAASTGDFVRGLDSANAVKFRAKSDGALALGSDKETIAKRSFAIGDVDTDIAAGAAIMLVIRDTTNGGMAIVAYENGTAPVLVANIGGRFTTAAPVGTDVQIKNRTGNLGLAAVMASGSASTLDVIILTADDA